MLMLVLPKELWKTATILITLGSLPARAEDAPKYIISDLLSTPT